jgi:hypothetical protein
MYVKRLGEGSRLRREHSPKPLYKALVYAPQVRGMKMLLNFSIA